MFGFKRKSPAEGAPQEWRRQGNAALARGALEEAEAAYRSAAKGGDVPAQVNLAYVLLQRGQPQAAEPWLERVVGTDGTPADTAADAHFLLAQCARAQGRNEAALQGLLAALTARPSFEEALQEAVPLLIEGDRAGEARQFARRACGSAGSAISLMQLARSQHACGEPAAALATIELLLARASEDAGALAVRGNLLVELGRPKEALASHDRALALQGPQPDVLCNRATALLRLGRAADALAGVDEALRLAPRHREALYVRGQSLLGLMRVEEARVFTAQACSAYPDDADLQWNRAVAHLLLGDFETGWAAHEARWNASGFVRSAGSVVSGVPRWSGQETDATLLVSAEQGLGDAIQFVRYVPEAARRAREVLLRLPTALQGLAFALPSNCRVLRVGDPAPAADFECPLLSLPHALRAGAPPAGAVPYVHADQARSLHWTRGLGGAGLKVGIIWSGNPLHTNDHNRSIALTELGALADAPVRFVNLQPQVRETERAALAEWPGLVDAGRELRDFADTAALVTALDLVISVDTSVAHLAGALGRPVWILLPFSPDWRWQCDREDSSWYPTARLFRQPAPGAWAPVLQRVRTELVSLAAGPAQ